MLKIDQPSSEPSPDWQKRVAAFYLRVRSLQGDPHYLSMGMAVGVFVAFTPTIPFHTVLTLLLAFLLRGSKPAALIGSWLSNPLTFPVFYYGSYKLGAVMLGRTLPAHIQYDDIHGIMTLGWDVAVAMIAGGVMLGLLPAVGVYFVTLHLFRRIRAHRSADFVASSDPLDTQVHPHTGGMNSRKRAENKDN